MGKKYKIAQFGAFDVESYGDSLFPAALYAGLKTNIEVESITLFSPTARQKGYNQNVVYAYDEFETKNQEMNFDFLVIGGGELLHFQPISFRNSKGQQIYKEGFLWKQPLEWAQKYELPVILNAVGVPYEFSNEQKEILKECLKPVVYCTVRDVYSYARMKGLVSEDKLQIVPDSVWQLNTIYDEEKLHSSRKQVEKKFACDLSVPYVVVQYGTMYEIQKLAAQIAEIKENYHLQVVVLPINYSHEDFDAVVYLEKHIAENVVYIDQLLQPVEIASIISGAAAFVGTSLHGNLTAMRYGVKSIAIDMYPTIASKIDGLFKMVNREQYVILEVDHLADIFGKAMEDKNDDKQLRHSLQIIEQQIAAYFAHIPLAIENKIASEEGILISHDNVVLKKMYAGYVTKEEKRECLKCIAPLEHNQYVFTYVISGIKENVMELVLTIDKPTRVKILSCQKENQELPVIIEKKSANTDDVYMERTVQFVLSDIVEGTINIVCEIESVNSSELELQYFETLNNKQMHVEQLIQAERKYLSSINTMKETIQQKDVEISEKNSVIAQNEMALNKNKQELEKKNIKINNQRGHIEQLLEVDRNYQRIIHSKGWRLVSFPGRMFEKLYPLGTPRREKVSTVAKYIRALNWTNVKFVCAAFKKGGMTQVKKELHAFENRTADEMPMVEPEIDEIEEITDIKDCEVLSFKKQENPKVSIVIPVYNQFTYTYHCLKSILENSGDVSYEIIIADDVSTDLTLRLAEVAHNIHIVRNKENQMFLRNCNNAAQYAKGEYILFLNNDTQVQDNWLAPLITLIESDEQIGMVGSKLIYPDGSLQEAGGIIWGPGHAWNYGNGQNAELPQFNYVKEVDYISGASIMIRSSLWKEIGGFDDYFAPAYCEDSDLAFAVRKHGYKLMYQPLSVVVHFEGKSNGTDTSTGIKSYQVENSKKLKEKWKDEFAKQSQSEVEVFRARERSQNKKVILVIDHYVPQFDKDAGSKTTWQYLKMFVKQGYSVKFLGDNFYQDEPYTTALQQIGVEVLYGPWYANNYKQWIIDNQKDIDFVYLNRPHITEKYIDFLKEETDIKCIYYGHDLHFLRIKREYELSGDTKLLTESEEWRRKEFAIMEKADISYYPSYVEVEEIHKVNENIKAKAITAYVYEQFRENLELDFSKKKGILFVGGFGHPPNEDAVLWFVEHVYPLIRKEQDIPFYIVGSKASDKIKKLDGNGIIVKGFVSEEELEELYNTCKVVVVPLRYGAGVKGKVVEALYYGTPMVTTTVGAEGLQGVEDFMEITDDAKTFAKKVVALYNDDNKLAQTVKNYQEYIRKNNSIEAVWDIVKEDFQ